MKIIDYSVIDDNIKELSKTKQLMLVLKDNAYNFDFFKVLRIALKEKITRYAVNTIDEAIDIRRISEDAEILVLGKNNSTIADLKKYKIMITIDSLEELKYCLANDIWYHLKINTSMNRFGIDLDADIEPFISPNLRGLYIHLPTSSIHENLKIIYHFKWLIEKYKLTNLNNHIGGSSALKIKTNLIYRIGDAIYKNALSFYGNVIKIREIKSSQMIGYNHGYKARENILVAVIDLGYANGLPRISEDYCFINQKRYKFIGLKCMNNAFILIDKDVAVGDLVEIIGSNQSISEYAGQTNRIIHEIYLQLL